MPLTIEDGTGVLNANSYQDAATLEAYATTRGITISGDPEQLLIRAMDYLEGLSWTGERIYSTIGYLSHPRAGIYIGYELIPDDIVHPLVVEGQAEAALAIDGGFDPLAPVEQAVKRKKAEGLEKEFMDGSSPVPQITALTNKLAPLLVGGGSGFNLNIVRA